MLSIAGRGGKTVSGVIGTHPPHIQKAADREKVIPVEEMFLDVGAGSRQEGVAMGGRGGECGGRRRAVLELGPAWGVGGGGRPPPRCPACRRRAARPSRERGRRSRGPAGISSCRRKGCRGWWASREGVAYP